MPQANVQVKLQGKYIIVSSDFGEDRKFLRTSQTGIVLESFINNPQRVFPDSLLDEAVRRKKPWPKLTDKQFAKLTKQFQK